MEGVDLSYGKLTETALAKMRSAGVQAIFQCLWTGAEQPPPRVVNLRAALNAGFTIGGYISVTGSQGGCWHVERARAGVPDDIWDALVLVPIDVELTGIPNGTIRDAVEAVAELGKRRAIYTNYLCWVYRQGNPTSFGDCLLWNAYWDADRDIDFPSLSYGGWAESQVVGEQYAGGSSEPFGVEVDRDTFMKELLMPKTAVEERLEYLEAQTKYLAGTVEPLAERINGLCTIVEALAKRQQDAGRILAPPS